MAMFRSELPPGRTTAPPAIGFGSTVVTAPDHPDEVRRLESRALVQRAKGLLMAWDGLAEPDAFRRIQRTSMNTRIPMATIARAVLLTAEVRRQTPSR